MENEFIKLIMNALEPSFFIQYFTTKVIDQIKFRNRKNQDEEINWIDFYISTLELLCRKMEWEFDSEAVNRELNDKDFSIANLDNNDNIDKILCKLLGKKYEEKYSIDVVDKWKECIIECLGKSEFDMIYKVFIIEKHNIIIEKNNSIIESQKTLIEEVKKIKNSQQEIKRTLKMKDKSSCSNDNEELESAEEDIYIGEYESAIDKYKRFCCCTKDNHKKFICYLNIAYCHSKLNIEDNYEKALKWYEKAQKICDYEKDDVVLLFSNMALAYVYIGQKERKVDNYKKSNEYFKKVLMNTKSGDELYYYEALVHIARNYIDMCDEVPLKEVLSNLEISEAIFTYLCHIDCRLDSELMYVLVNNMGRLFQHKAEKVDIKYIKEARELFEYVLTLDYVKENKELSAMSYGNVGISYAYGEDNILENLKKAESCYEIAIDLYSNLGDMKSFQKNLLNVKLNLSDTYMKLYLISKDLKYFEKAVRTSNEIIEKESFSSGNSLLFRTYLLQLMMCINGLKNNINPKDYIDLENMKSKLEVVSIQVNYEKYILIYKLLMCELELLLNKDNIDKTNSIRNEIIKIQKSVNEGNVNILRVVKRLLENY